MKRLPVQFGYNSHTSFISLLELSRRVFGTSFLKAYTFEHLVVSPTNFILDQWTNSPHLEPSRIT